MTDMWRDGTLRMTARVSYRLTTAACVLVASLCIAGSPVLSDHAHSSSAWYWENPLPHAYSIRAESVRAGTPDTWTAVAPLKTGLLWPAAASADRKLYVFGGLGCNSEFCQTFEAYDPRTNRWTSMGDVPQPLVGLPSAITGPDGLIYYFGFQQGGGAGAMLVYHPKGNSWSRGPSPPGVDEAAILLTGRDGRIYAVGGQKNGPAGTGALSAYNIRTRKWTRLAPNPKLASQPAAAVGPDGRIYAIESDQTSSHVQAYDPRTNTWTSIAATPTPRFSSQAVTGPDGRIYVLGGEGRCFTAPCNDVQAFDVHTGKWTRVASMPHGRWSFAAAVGPDGRIYALGGFTTANQTKPGSPFPSSVDAYTVVPGNQPLPKPPPPTPAIVTTKLAPMPTGRDDLGATSAGGKIYAIGGEQVIVPSHGPSQAPKVLKTVETYDPATNTWATEPSLPAPRMDMGVTTGPDGRIYVLGGVATPLMTSTDSNNGVPGLRSVEIFDPSTNSWSKGKPMPDGRYAFTAVTGKDGLIYTIGGATDCSFGSFRKAELMLRVRPARDPAQPGFPSGLCDGTQMVRSFDPGTDTWKTLAPLHVGRVFPAAAVGADGRIYVFGGDDSDSLPSRRFEVYDPSTNRWTVLKGMPHIRSSGFAAAADGSGHIDLIGGCLIGSLTKSGFSEYCGDPDPVDSYDPQTNRWTKLGVALDTRQGLAATAGSDGQVYVIGGAGYGNGKLLEVIRQGSVGAHGDR